MNLELPFQTQELIFGTLVQSAGVNCIEFYNGSAVVKTADSSRPKYFTPIKTTREKSTKSAVLAMYDTPQDREYVASMVNELTALPISPANYTMWTSTIQQQKFLPADAMRVVSKWTTSTQTNSELMSEILNSQYNFIEPEMIKAWGTATYTPDGLYPDPILSAYIIKGTARTGHPILVTFGAKSLSSDLPNLLILPAHEWLRCINYYALTTKADYITSLEFVS